MPHRTPIRHGEILLVPSLPSHSADQDVTNYIVEHSESGHHHVLEGDQVFTQIVATNGDMFVDLPGETALRHRKTDQRYRELTVPAGVSV